MNEYEKVCKEFNLTPNDIRGLIKLDRHANFHKHRVTRLEGRESAVCSICASRLGWYCPTSPTLLCNYTQKDGSYNEDMCRYCGEPHERK